MMRKFIHSMNEEIGTTAIEYAFISSLIAMVIVGALTAVGISIVPIFTSVATNL